MVRGCDVLRQLEADRLDQLKGLAEQMHLMLADHWPKLVAGANRLHEPILNCDVAADMEPINKKVGLVLTYVHVD